MVHVNSTFEWFAKVSFQTILIDTYLYVSKRKLLA